MGPRSSVGWKQRTTGWNYASNLGPSNSRRHLCSNRVDRIMLQRSNSQKRIQQCKCSIQTGMSEVKLETEGACITIPITSVSSGDLKKRILQGLICVQSGVIPLFSCKCTRDIAERCASKQSVLL